MRWPCSGRRRQGMQPQHSPALSVRAPLAPRAQLMPRGEQQARLQAAPYAARQQSSSAGAFDRQPYVPDNDDDDFAASAGTGGDEEGDDWLSESASDFSRRAARWAARLGACRLPCTRAARLGGCLPSLRVAAALRAAVRTAQVVSQAAAGCLAGAWACCLACTVAEPAPA